jgi:hypothetical protein
MGEVAVFAYITEYELAELTPPLIRNVPPFERGAYIKQSESAMQVALHPVMQLLIFKIGVTVAKGKVVG